VTLNEANARIEAAGYHASSAGWEDENTVNAFSVETFGPATYNHPRAEIQYRKDTGTTWATRC
jgi:hypothetical protein